MGFSRQECWSRVLRPPLGDLSNPRIEPRSIMSPALAAGFFTISATQDLQDTRGKGKANGVNWRRYFSMMRSTTCQLLGS